MNENSQFHKILEKLNQIKNIKNPEIPDITPSIAVLQNDVQYIKETCERIDVKLEQKASRRTVNTFAVIIVSLFTAWLSALTVLRFVP